MTTTPLPRLGIQAHHQAELDAGRFFIQRCGACHRHVYYPRVVCTHCGAMALNWVEPAGTGRVHAVTTVARKPAEGGDFNVSLVDLDEGVRLMGRVDGVAPAAVQIGQRVRARVEVVEGRGRVVFDVVDPAEAGADAASAAATTGGQP
ncbi:MAG: hypothetical protein RIQ60_2336 [Pseudomonadota bacterium]|jgi:uncharacterized OB-fold protein